MWAIIELDDIYVNICVCVWLDWVDTCQWLLFILLFFFYKERFDGMTKKVMP